MTGCARNGLAIDKSNWAQKLDTPPYEAYGVTSGVTFTFGGLKVSNDTEVQDVDHSRVHGARRSMASPRVAAFGKGFGCRPGASDGPVRRPAYESHRRTNRRDSG